MTDSKHNLVQITEQEFHLTLCLVYATKNNFTGQPIYRNPLCYLHPEAARCLRLAIDLILPLRLRLKIWDGYRPLSAQQILFNHKPDPQYVSHPETGKRSHCRGIAVDLTLTDEFNNELEMGTHVDDFRSLAHHGNDQISEEAQRNRLLLAGIMSIAGFEPVATEWWHYQLPDSNHYAIIRENEIPDSLM